jgi:hypothetical protein
MGNVFIDTTGTLFAGAVIMPYDIQAIYDDLPNTDKKLHCIEGMQRCYGCFRHEVLVT